MTRGRSKGNKGQIGWRQLIAAGTASMTLAGLGGSALARQQNTSESPDLSGVEALTFDVFGTVVDWRTSIIREGELLGQRKGIEIDWEAFADAWRAGYGPATNRVRTGELPWTKIDGLHRLILDDLLEQFEIRGLAPEEIDDLHRIWRRLLP